MLEKINVENLRRWGLSLWAVLWDAIKRLHLVILVTVISVYMLPGDDKRFRPLRVGGEMFPLSSFPMYSRNKRKSYVVYLRDDKGDPIACEKQLGVRASVLKKDYEGVIKKLREELDMSDFDMTPEQRRPAAESVLRYLVTERSPDLVEALGTSSLELVDLRIIREDGKIEKREEVVGRLEL